MESEIEKETIKTPPSKIRIRTLKNDIEQMRNSGGETSSSRVLGQSLEDVETRYPIDAEKEKPLFEGGDSLPQQTGGKKSKILPIAIVVLLVFILGGALVYFVLRPQLGNEVQPTPTATVTPNYSSLFLNSVGEKVFVQFSGETIDFEKIIAQEFKKNYNPGSIKEVVFLKNETDPFPANDFFRSVFSGLSGISSADLPDFYPGFSFLIYNAEQAGANNLAYVFKMNTADLPVFAVSNIKARFGTELEKFVDGHTAILASQYLQDVGRSIGSFQSQSIGPVSARFLKFSAGPEFYYGWYQDNFIIATSRLSFERLLQALLPSIN